MPDQIPAPTNAAPATTPPAAELKAPPEAPKVETKPADPKPVEAAKPDAQKERESTQWKAVLSQKDQLLKEQRALAAEREAIKAEKAEAARVKALLTEAKTNPLKLLEAVGLTADQFAEGLAKGGPTPELAVKAVQDQVKSLEAKLAEQEAAKKAEAEAAEKAKQQAEIIQYVEAVSAEVAKAAEKFPITAGLKRGGQVAKKIVDHLKETTAAGAPVHLNVEEAAALVEKELTEQVTKETKAFLSSGKAIRDQFRALLAEYDKDDAPAKPKADAPEAAPKPVVRRRPTSLDNSMAPTTAAAASKLPTDRRAAWEELKARHLKGNAANGVV